MSATPASWGHRLASCEIHSTGKSTRSRCCGHWDTWSIIPSCSSISSTLYSAPLQPGKSNHLHNLPNLPTLPDWIVENGTAMENGEQLQGVQPKWQRWKRRKPPQIGIAFLLGSYFHRIDSVRRPPYSPCPEKLASGKLMRVRVRFERSVIVTATTKRWGSCYGLWKDTRRGSCSRLCLRYYGGGMASPAVLWQGACWRICIARYRASEGWRFRNIPVVEELQSYRWNLSRSAPISRWSGGIYLGGIPCGTLLVRLASTGQSGETDSKRWTECVCAYLTAELSTCKPLQWGHCQPRSPSWCDGKGRFCTREMRTTRHVLGSIQVGVF